MGCFDDKRGFSGKRTEENEVFGEQVLTTTNEAAGFVDQENLDSNETVSRFDFLRGFFNKHKELTIDMSKEKALKVNKIILTNLCFLFLITQMLFVLFIMLICFTFLLL